MDWADPSLDSIVLLLWSSGDEMGAEESKGRAPL